MVDGSIVCPSLFVLDSHGREIRNPNYYNWLKIDQIVRSWLFATLTRDTLIKVYDLKFSTPIWE